jgi:L-lactate dehydrogenase (cytochrome)
MLGEETSLPIFISPAGMAGLAHPLAEKGLAKAAGVCGIIQMVRRRAERERRGEIFSFATSDSQVDERRGNVNIISLLTMMIE